MTSRANGLWRRAIPRLGWDRATAALTVFAALLVIATFRDYGSTWDARFQRDVGQAAVAWWASAGADTRALEGGVTGNLNLYGGLYEGVEEIAASSLPFHPLESRHLINALLALVGVAGAAMLARRLGGPRAAFLATALLLTTPAWWGHGFANSKDVPFAAPYPWMLLALLRLADDLPRPSARRIVAAGLALGCCLAARPGGLLLILPLVAFIVTVRALPVLAGDAERIRAVARVAGGFAAVLAIGWAGMVVAWPYGLLHPFSAPLEAIAQAQTHPWGGLVRFAGGWHPATHLPRSYAPVWFLATLPESWFATAGAGLVAAVFAWRRDRIRPALEAAWLDPALVAAAAFGPVLAAVVMRPVLYDGIRHLLFVLPALAAFGGWALSVSADRLPRWGGRAALAATGGLAALAVADAVRLHPYQYVYFNRAVAGGLAGASRDFELDYWGATGREAMAWVVKNVAPRRAGALSVATTADSTVASYWVRDDAGTRFVFEAPGPPDLRLATTRWFDHRATGRTLHVVERMGVPLLYVIDTAPGAGPLVLEAGDLGVALSPAVGWLGNARIEPGDERAAFILRRAIGTPAVVEALVLTPGDGPVPELEQLRSEVARRAAELMGAAPGSFEPQPVVGPEVRGWVATSDGAAPAGAPFGAVAAFRVGDAAVVLSGRYAGDAAGASRELLEWVRGARIADAGDRRPP